MRLMCPNCLAMVNLPDEAAGTDAPCPRCGKPFAAPARYDPVVAVERTIPPVPTAPVTTPPAVEPAPMSSGPIPAPPPGLVPLNEQSPNAAAAPPLPTPPAGYAHSRGVTFSPRVVAWVPAVGLLAILLLTPFSWAGLYPGGYAAYTQSPWQALFGSFSRDIGLEYVLHAEAPLTERVRSDWELMLPYLLGLFAAALIAGADRALRHNTAVTLPRRVARLQKAWPYRATILVALAGLLLLLLGAQLAAGFGLERAARKYAAEQAAADRQKAGITAPKPIEVEVQDDQALARYRLRNTTWLDVAVLLHVAVLAALILHFVLERRADRPPPRVVLQY